MARSQFTFTFRNAEPGAAVTFSAAVYSSPADQTPDGPTLVLDASRTVAVWADVTELTATWVDGSGAAIDAEASVAIPVVVETGGVAGASPSGGSATVGAPIVRAFPFAFDTPNLVTGHTVWTPAVGDILIDAWIEVTSAWNGTTPKGDFAQFIGGDTNGCFEDQDAGVDLTVADTTDGVAMPAGLLYQAHPGSQPASLLSMQANSAGSPRAVRPQRRVPAKFTTADPVKVVVTQDGTQGGTDAGATAGAAILYLITCTPAT